MKKYEVIYKERGRGVKETDSIVVEAESSVAAVEAARDQLDEKYTVRTVKLVREPKQELIDDCDEDCEDEE